MNGVLLEAILLAIVNYYSPLVLDNHEHVFGGGREFVVRSDHLTLVTADNLLDTFV